MHLLVMGTGGLGGYFGGLLARSGVRVTFIARGDNLRALQQHGLTVRSVHGDFTITVQACAEPGALAAVDVILFCVKTYAAAAAAAQLQAVVAPHTIVLTVQNGVDMAADLQTTLGCGTVLAGITRMGSTLVAPGVIEQPTLNRSLEIGALRAADAPQVERLAGLLRRADIPVTITANIQRSLWTKLVFISAFSGLSTLTGLTPNQLLAHEPTRQLYRTVMEETAAVAQAAGLGLATDIVPQTLADLDAAGDLGLSSMAVDFQRHRPIEVEAINGAVVKHGQRLGVPTPANATIYAALTVMDVCQRTTA